MGARAVVFDLLKADTYLHDEYGIDADRVFPAQAVDTSPRSGYWLALRWGATAFEIDTHGPETLTVWCHRSRAECLDYLGHTNILLRVRDILTAAEHLAGADGTLTCVRSHGFSADFNDEVLGTLTKNAEFSVLSR